jgi:hypothetical protein
MNLINDLCVFSAASNEGSIDTGMAVGFIRVKLLQCERGDAGNIEPNETFDPYVAVNVKEALNTPGE